MSPRMKRITRMVMSQVRREVFSRMLRILAAGEGMQSGPKVSIGPPLLSANRLVIVNNSLLRSLITQLRQIVADRRSIRPLSTDRPFPSSFPAIVPNLSRQKRQVRQLIRRNTK